MQPSPALRRARSAAALVLALASLALGPGCRGDGGPPEMTDEQKLELYTETASYLYEDGSLLRAQDQAVKALELDPENVAMRRMIGWIRLRLGRDGTTRDLTISEDFFRGLHDEGDRHPATIQGLAAVCERLGVGFDKLARDLEAGVREPGDGRSLDAALDDARARRDAYWDEAVELYASTLADGEGSTRSKNGLQRVYALQGRYEESLAMSEQVLDDARAELAQWRRMLEGQDLTERDEDLMRSNEAAATRLAYDTHLFASELQFKLGRYGPALEDLEEAELLNPGEPELYSARAQVRARLEDFAGAIEDIDRYLKQSDTPLEHPDVRRAFDLRAECEDALARAGGAPTGPTGG